MAISLLGNSISKKPQAASAYVKDTTTQTFRADVLDASKKVPVLVDFWAPWCGPCKQLTPILENVVNAAKGAVLLVKMNIDDYPEIAGQLGVQSIPAVFAFKNGQPVDGFMGALPQSQVEAFVKTLVGGGQAAKATLESAQAALDANDLSGAAAAFATVLQEEPDNVDAISGLARCYLRTGDLKRAEQTLGLVPAAKQTAEAFVSVRAAVELFKKTNGKVDLAALSKAVENNPKDWDARFKLALALNAKGDRDQAMQHLFEIVRRDRTWNDDAARKQLVELFEAWGSKDPLTTVGRQRLSSMLFA